MIDRIVIKNFKSFRNVDLKLGRMNLFIGTNASGKSNFLDALRFLQGIGNGFTIGEILGGKPRTATTGAWTGIRGGSRYALFTCAEDTDEVTIEIYGKLSGLPERNWEYQISFAPECGELREEELSVESEWYLYSGSSKSISWCGERDDKAIESQLPSPAVVPLLGTHRPFPECRHLNECRFAVRGMLANTQRVDVSRRMLEWLDHFDNGTTFLCHRHEATGESTIRPLTEVPHFNEVVQKSRIGDLLVEGWLEAAL